MRRSVLAVLAVAVELTLTCPVTHAAQNTIQLHPGAGGSPHVRSEWMIDGAAISIEYGRPRLKGRSEAEMMPAGRPWRIGADEATTFKIDKAMMLGTLALPAGTYTLYAISRTAQWTLIVSKRVGQWGIPYPAGQDFGRTTMALGMLSAPLEQLTISLDDTAAGGVLKIEWGTTSASVPFTVR